MDLRRRGKKFESEPKGSRRKARPGRCIESSTR
jgi:hypothetical protein